MMVDRKDVSPDFTWTAADSEVVSEILQHEATPRAIKVFSRLHPRLSDYAYWFILSTLWVSYTGFSDLEEWKRLFSSPRPNRKTGIMKPSELAVFEAMADPLVIYRAHRPGETDWIAYTTDPLKAGDFARRRGVAAVSEYVLPKADALCLFLRRGENEVLVLDKTKPVFVGDIPVIIAPGPAQHA